MSRPAEETLSTKQLTIEQIATRVMVNEGNGHGDQLYERFYFEGN